MTMLVHTLNRVHCVWVCWLCVSSLLTHRVCNEDRWGPWCSRRLLFGPILHEERERPPAGLNTDPSASCPLLAVHISLHCLQYTFNNLKAAITIHQFMEGGELLCILQGGRGWEHQCRPLRHGRSSFIHLGLYSDYVKYLPPWCISFVFYYRKISSDRAFFDTDYTQKVNTDLLERILKTA